ncbi:MAG: phage tail tape measure protein [Candidatus Melainabacteria bacterium HGW-Melainabacteria-1]|nr:MAG: phage tail tape measure protein [Candidatus Melainabacteria bacterium HGW-Melainabacteria-1]
MNDTKTYAFDLDFAYDDVTEGLLDITRTGKSVMDVFVKMADQIALSTTKAGQTAKKQIDPLAALGKAADQVLKGVVKNLGDLERKTRQVDMSPIAKQADAYSEKIRVAQAAVAQLDQQVKQATGSEEKRAKAVEALAQAQLQLNNLMQAQTSLQGMAKLKDSTKAAETQAKATASAYRELGQAVTSVAGDVRNASGILAATLTIGIGASTNKFIELSDQTATFRAVANATESDVKHLVETAKGLEGIKAVPAAQAAVALSRAGLSAREATDQLGNFNRAALATGESMATVSDLILSTNRAYGLSNSELSRTTDIMVTAANATSTSITEVGHAMSIMASSAKSNNQALLSTATVFGLLRDQGISGEMAATGYKNALNAMATPAKKTREAMDELYKTTDAAKKVFTENGKMRDFSVIMAELKTKLEGFSDVKKANILEKIFPDERSLNIVRSYFSITEEKIESTTAAIQKFEGETERTANIMKQSLGFEFREMQKNLETLQIEFGDKMSPTISRLIELLNSLIGAWDGLSQPLQEAVASGVLLTAGVASLITFLSQLVISIGGAAFAYNSLTGAAAKAAAQQAALAASAATAEAGLATVGTTATATGASMAAASFIMTGGIIAIVAEVMIAIKAFNDWRKAVEDLEDAERTLDDARRGFQGGLDAIQNTPDASVTPDAARKAERDARDQLNRIKETISTLRDLKEAMAGLRDSGDINQQTALQNQVNSLKVNIRQAGIIAEDVQLEQIDSTILSLENRLRRVETAAERAERLQREKNGVKPRGATPAGAGGQLDNDTADPGNDKSMQELERFISALDARTDAQIAADKKGIASMREFQAVAAEVHEEAFELQGKARNIYQAFLGEQPISYIRGVGGKHAGVDLQAKADYQKQYGSMVYAPEQMEVTAVNANLPYGAMVKFRSLLNKEIEYVLHHLSPGDVRKNIRVGQTFGAGEALNARVGGLAEIKPGDHWAGVHLHVEKYFKGALDTIDRTKNLTTTLKQRVGGVSKEEMEARKTELENQKAAVRLQEALNQLIAKRNEIQSKYGTESKEYEKINNAVLRKEAELAGVQKNGEEARQRQIQQRAEAIKRAHDQIAQLEAEHQAVVISLMEEGYTKIEAMRQAELDKNDAEKDKTLRDFKGTVEQKVALEGQFNQREFDINAKHNKAKLELEERFAREALALDNEVEAGRVASMQESLAKQKAQIQLELKTRLDALDQQQRELEKQNRKDSQAWKAVEALKTQATEDATSKRIQAEKQYFLDLASARRQAMDALLSDNQKSFASQLEGMAKGETSRGKTPGQIARGLKPDELQGLAGSLGLDSAAGLLSNLTAQLEQSKASADALLDLQRDTLVGSTQYLGYEKSISGEKQEQARLQLLINVLSDQSLQSQLKGYQKLLPNLKEQVEMQEKMQALISGVGGALADIAGVFGEMGRNVSAGINIMTGALSASMQVMQAFDRIKPTSGWGGTDVNKLNPNEIKDVIGLLTTAATAYWGFASQAFGSLLSAEQHIQTLVDQRLASQADGERALAKERLEIRKRNGEDVLMEEIRLIELEVAAREASIRNQMQVNDDKWVWNAQDLIEKQKADLELKKQLRESQAELRKQTEELRRAAFEQRLKDEQAFESRAADAKLTAAKLGNDRLAVAEAESAQAKLAIRQKYDDIFADATHRGVQDQSAITQATPLVWASAMWARAPSAISVSRPGTGGTDSRAAAISDAVCIAVPLGESALRS